MEVRENVRMTKQVSKPVARIKENMPEKVETEGAERASRQARKIYK